MPLENFSEASQSERDRYSHGSSFGRSHIWENTFPRQEEPFNPRVSLDGLESARNLRYSTNDLNDTQHTHPENLVEFKFFYWVFQYAEKEMQARFDVFNDYEKKCNLALFTLFTFVEILIRSLTEKILSVITWISLLNFVCLMLSSTVFVLVKSFRISKLSRKLICLSYIIYVLSFAISNDGSEVGCFLSGSIFISLPVLAAGISIYPVIILVVQLAAGLALTFTMRSRIHTETEGYLSAVSTYTVFLTLSVMSVVWSFEKFRTRKDVFETTLKLLSKNRFRKTQLENEAAREKLSYIAQIAHDIGTPLAAISLSLDLLAEANLTPAEVNDTVQRSKCALEMMKVTRDEALDDFKLMSGLDLTPRIVEVNLKDLLRKCSDIMKSFEEGQQSKVYKFFMDDWVPFKVMTDYNWVWSMLINYMSNATKYCTKGEIAVVVMIAQDPKFLRIEVSDEGIGIQEDQKDKLFKRFGQLQRGAGGTGLGLHGVYTKAKALGGRVGVRHNTAVASGSVFWFEFPHKVKLDPGKKALLGSLAVLGHQTILDPLIPSLGKRFSATDRVPSNAYLRGSLQNNIYTKANVKFSIYLIATSQFPTFMPQQEMEEWVESFKTTQSALYQRSSCPFPFLILIFVEAMFHFIPEKTKTTATFNDTNGSQNFSTRSFSRKKSSSSSNNFHAIPTMRNHRSRFMERMRVEFIKQRLPATIHYWSAPASEEECFSSLFNTINRTLPERCIINFRSPAQSSRPSEHSEVAEDEIERQSWIWRNHQAFSNSLQPVSFRRRSNSSIIEKQTNSILRQAVPRLNLEKNIKKKRESLLHAHKLQSSSSMQMISARSSRRIPMNLSSQNASGRSSGRSGLVLSKMTKGHLTQRRSSSSQQKDRVEKFMADVSEVKTSEPSSSSKPNNEDVGDESQAAPTLTVFVSPRVKKEQKNKILVVEDELSILKFMTKLLGKKYIVETASNGFVGLNLMQDKAYHAVLMDLNMPVMDGFEAIERFRMWETICLKEGSRSKRQIVIVCSANAHDGHIQAALNGGADAFVMKPLKVKEVINVIEELNQQLK